MKLRSPTERVIFKQTLQVNPEAASSHPVVPAEASHQETMYNYITIRRYTIYE